MINKKLNIIPKGYKQTKLGVIPEDWEMNTLGRLGSFSKGKGITKAQLIENGIPCIRYGELYTQHHIYIKKINSFINKETANNSNPIKHNDLLFAGSGETLNEIGKCAVYLKNELVYAGGDIIILSTINNIDSLYLAYLLNSDLIIRQRRKLGQGHSVVHIYPSGLKNLPVPLPPLPEQKRIAQILSTWDKAIEKQNLLIKKKTEQKKGLMQVLLEPKNDWKEVKLGKVCDIIMGQSPESKNYNSKGIGLHLIQGNADIKNRFSMPRIWTSQITKTCEIGDLLMTVRAPVGAIAKSLHKACIGRGMCSISYRVSNIDFIYHWLVSFENKWIKYEQGSTFTAVGSSDIKNLKLRTPNYETQTKIAKILSSADKEIELLNIQLEKLKEQKKGLMQVLLSGQIRVNIEN